MSVSQKPGLRRSWTGRKLQIFAFVLVPAALAFAFYGPNHPKGITFSGPLTMLVLAAVFWQTGFKIQLRADCRYYAARDHSPIPRGVANGESFDDDLITRRSAETVFAPEPSEDIVNAYWAQQRGSGRI